MIIDCHYHLEPRLLDIEGLLRQMDTAGVEKTALMAVVSDPIPKPPELLLNLLRFALTHRAFRFVAKRLAANFTPAGNLKIPAGVFRLYSDPDNDPVFAAATAHPDRFLAWAFVNPRGAGDPVALLDRWKAHPGFIGVKAHPFWNRFDPAALIPVARQLARLGKPLLIHAGFDANGDIQRLLDAVPDLKLILAHAGFPYFADTWKQIEGQQNVFVDLSQTSYLDDRTTGRAIAALGPGRCLFGTDGPYGVHDEAGGFDYGFIKRRIERLVADPVDRERILGENFRVTAGLD